MWRKKITNVRPFMNNGVPRFANRIIQNIANHTRRRNVLGKRRPNVRMSTRRFMFLTLRLNARRSRRRFAIIIGLGLARTKSGQRFPALVSLCTMTTARMSPSTKRRKQQRKFAKRFQRSLVIMWKLNSVKLSQHRSVNHTVPRSQSNIARKSTRRPLFVLARKFLTKFALQEIVAINFAKGF